MKKIIVLILFLSGCGGGISKPEHISRELSDCKVNDKDIAKKYSGECMNGFANGLGVAKGRDEYRGMFNNGNKHGKGVYTWANGSRYEGEWKDDDQAGKGVYTRANGSRYEGEYRDGKRNGVGKMMLLRNDPSIQSYTSDGYGVWDGDNYVIKGTWKDNNIYSSIYIDKTAEIDGCKTKWGINESTETPTNAGYLECVNIINNPSNFLIVKYRPAAKKTSKGNFNKEMIEQGGLLGVLTNFYVGTANANTNVKVLLDLRSKAKFNVFRVDFTTVLEQKNIYEAHVLGLSNSKVEYFQSKQDYTGVIHPGEAKIGVLIDFGVINTGVGMDIGGMGLVGGTMKTEFTKLGPENITASIHNL